MAKNIRRDLGSAFDDPRNDPEEVRKRQLSRRRPDFGDRYEEAWDTLSADPEVSNLGEAYQAYKDSGSAADRQDVIDALEREAEVEAEMKNLYPGDDALPLDMEVEKNRRLFDQGYYREDEVGYELKELVEGKSKSETKRDLRKADKRYGKGRSKVYPNLADPSGRSDQVVQPWWWKDIQPEVEQPTGMTLEEFKKHREKPDYKSSFEERDEKALRGTPSKARKAKKPALSERDKLLIEEIKDTPELNEDWEGFEKYTGYYPTNPSEFVADRDTYGPDYGAYREVVGKAAEEAAGKQKDPTRRARFGDPKNGAFNLSNESQERVKNKVVSQLGLDFDDMTSATSSDLMALLGGTYSSEQEFKTKLGKWYETHKRLFKGEIERDEKLVRRAGILDKMRDRGSGTGSGYGLAELANREAQVGNLTSEIRDMRISVERNKDDPEFDRMGTIIAIERRQIELGNLEAGNRLIRNASNHLVTRRDARMTNMLASGVEFVDAEVVRDATSEWADPPKMPPASAPSREDPPTTPYTSVAMPDYGGIGEGFEYIE